MGIQSVKDAALYLSKQGIRADIGNPGSVMPHLAETVVAVNMMESTAESWKAVAHICGPQQSGRTACEDLAAMVAKHWTDQGGQCSWGDYEFDGKAAIHIVKVYATWLTATADSTA